MLHGGQDRTNPFATVRGDESAIRLLPDYFEHLFELHLCSHVCVLVAVCIRGWSVEAAWRHTSSQ